MFTHPLDKETLLLPVPPIISYHRDQGFLLRFGFEIVREQFFDQSMECVWLLQKLINSQVQEHFILIDIFNCQCQCLKKWRKYNVMTHLKQNKPLQDYKYYCIYLLWLWAANKWVQKGPGIDHKECNSLFNIHY